MNLANKKVMIIGFARSGVGAAQLLCSQNAIVTINDIKPKKDFEKEIKMLEEYQITYVFGEKADDYVKEQDLIVVSPGVPTNLSFFELAKKLEIKVIGEMELGYLYTKCPITAITGTNGKTTTTALVGAIYNKSGRKTHIAGNIGDSLAACALDTKQEDLMSLEVSSFQLETIDQFKPRIATIINITPDHLDRHKTMREYTKIKSKIFMNQNENDYSVINYDEKRIRKITRNLNSNIFYFSKKSNIKNGVSIKKEKIVFCKKGQEDIEIMRPEEIRISGKHNLENALSAICMTIIMGIEPSIIRHTLATFEGVEHRLVFVEEVKGRRFINDSKGTNTASTICAIESMNMPTVIILGGYDKNVEFDDLAESMTDKIKAVVVLGQTSKKIANALLKSKYGAIHYAQDFESAVYRAYELSKPGYNILLSPACASYDMFKDFEERGHAFKKIVYELKESNQ
ncbi:MAG: UDP-N-acetylmuramoyl-L-alanine--D-glutamate ligase [Clostridiales bacterium]|nr:UDP-N-acetylmuramoyl-L-alanine--D-glutamate ligase [Clostridiales bacterium]